MPERRGLQRHRTLRSGKIIFNGRQSVIDCVVRNLSEGGTCLQVNSTAGIPTSFDLQLDGEQKSHACHAVWMTESRLGVEFREGRHDLFLGDSLANSAAAAESSHPSPEAAAHQSGPLLRSELLTLRAALDLIPVGIVLLDSESRAQFINQAFRRMWRLPDEKADSKPPFVALMYHGRDTRAYAIPSGDLDGYIAARVAHVKSGDPKPIDLRLTSGEVIRLQCTVLPTGGRMLSYTYVTDIANRSDEFDRLQAALDNVQQGIILLDPMLNAEFMNRAVRDLWKVPDEKAKRKPPYIELVADARKTGAFDVPPEALGKYIADRVALVRAGDPTPVDIPHADGRTIRSQCAVLPGGGRMLTYTDVTDLVERATQFEELATIDGLTGVYNRRQFNAWASSEWSRFQRYHRPLSTLLLDIDHFKSINDRFGHEVGDRALVHIATICKEEKRQPDIVGRIGGDEFSLLLPETDLNQARVIAERLRNAIRQNQFKPSKDFADEISLRASIGIAEGTLSMSSFDALLKRADQALYKAKTAGRDRIVLAEESTVIDLRRAAE